MATLIIGRHPDCDIVLSDPTVSRRHAELSEIGPDLYMVVDQNSTSGSFRLENREWRRFASGRLRVVDRLRFGAYEITLGDLLRKAGGRPMADLPSRPSSAAAPARIERDPVTGQIVVKTP